LKTPTRFHLIAPPYSGEVTKAYLSTPSGSAAAVKRTAWG
jgi:hypothetical protein